MTTTSSQQVFAMPSASPITTDSVPAAVATKIPAQYRLGELMKDEKFQLIFKQVVADNINRLELIHVYNNIPGADRQEKAEALIADFADITQKKVALNSNLKQLDEEIIESQGVIHAFEEFRSDWGMHITSQASAAMDLAITRARQSVIGREQLRRTVVDEMAALYL